MVNYIVALTGASGIIYGIRLAEELLGRKHSVHLIASKAAYIVMEQELGWKPETSLLSWQSYLSGDLHVYDNEDIAARLASGSFITEAMIVIPCTMATVSALAVGSSRSLTERAADVTLKEKRRLLIVPRETPLNTVHLRNMLALSEMGVHVIPAMPAFYHCPDSLADMVNFMVGKVLDALLIDNNLYQRYIRRNA